MEKKKTRLNYIMCFLCGFMSFDPNVSLCAQECHSHAFTYTLLHTHSHPNNTHTS